MCTVTFISSADKIYLTSNRDENFLRKQALPPRFYFHNDEQLIYPKDEDAGGTWIAANKNGNAAVLLNGAFVKHIPTPPYRKSRGLVFLDVIKSRMPLKYFLNTDLLNIEPFTLVLFENNNLYECRWNGSKKYAKKLERFKPYIWSSATLYDADIIEKREEWFYNWIHENKRITQNAILNFHCFAGDGNKNTDLLMNRDDKVYTVSITSIELNNESAMMHYLDLKNKETHLTEMEFANSATLQYEYHA
jgi:uncharacterized protein with NRDE domain